MTDDDRGLHGSSSLSWRVTVLERELQRIKDGKPDVIADRVGRLSEDIGDIRDDVESLARSVDAVRRTFIGLLVTIAASSLMIIVAQILVAKG